MAPPRGGATPHAESSTEDVQSSQCPHRRESAAPGRVYIGRPSKWGNPFVIGRDGSREEVIEKYRVARVATRVARRARRTPRPRSGLLVRAAVVPRRRADRAREPGLTSSAPSRRRGRFRMPSAKLGSIAAAPLGAQQFQEKAHGLGRSSSKEDLGLCGRSFRSRPSAHEAGLPEQRPFDRQRIEPGHVPTRVHAFDIEAIALRNHSNRISAGRSPPSNDGFNR